MAVVDFFTSLYDAMFARHVASRAEIDDELMFHMRSLVEANVAQGMPLENAWTEAEQRFGSVRNYADACRRVSVPQRMLVYAVPLAGLLILAALVSWLLLEVRSLRRDQAALLAAQSMNGAARQVAFAEEQARSIQPVPDAPAKLVDLVGSTVDRQGRPIEGANIMVILKTWPGGRYRQEPFATKTGKDGSFRIAKLIPAQGQVAVQLAAAKDGYVLTSRYQVRERGDDKPLAPADLKLEDAAPLVLSVRDAAGKPAAKARVAPISRRNQEGDSHFTYFQGSEPIHVSADVKGSVKLATFQRGDQAEVYVQLPGYDWESYTVLIPGEGDSVEVTTKDTLDEQAEKSAS